MRTTHTYALMEIPQEVFDLVREKLEAAGYEHAVHNDNGQLCLDMHGIALVVEQGLDQ